MPDHSIERVVPTGNIFILVERNGKLRQPCSATPECQRRYNPPSLDKAGPNFFPLDRKSS
ncbi:MAG: hypothetical protein OXU30_11645 [Gammaproteobacteria bacterium]|nr:hypothetical protein [Gammaproteobacteria bacterium]